MRKLLLALLLALASAVPAAAQYQCNWNSSFPCGARDAGFGSGNVAAAGAVGGVSGSPGKFAYLCGFSVTGAGATGASVVTVSVAGVDTAISGLTWLIVVPAGVTTSIVPLTMNFNPCLPAATPNSNITVNVPSFGTGNTNAMVSVWGYQY